MRRLREALEEVLDNATTKEDEDSERAERVGLYVEKLSIGTIHLYLHKLPQEEKDD